MYIAYYGGDGEYAEQTAVYGMRKKKDRNIWIEPAVIADTPFRSDGNAVIWQVPDGLVWLFYVCRFGDTWSTSRIKAKISRDGAHTWSDSFFIALEEGMMVRGQPIVLADGDYLLPVYHETGHDTEIVGARQHVAVLAIRSEDQEVERVETHSLAARQHPAGRGAIDRRLPGGLLPARRRLWAGHRGLRRPHRIARRRRHLERRAGHQVPQPERRDRFHQTAKRPPAAGLQRQRDGPHAADGRHFDRRRQDLSPRRDIATGDHDYAYPYAIQTADGKIHLVYTSEARSVINHAVFDEGAILGATSK